jgi:hypothetical protein
MPFIIPLKRLMLAALAATMLASQSFAGDDVVDEARRAIQDQEHRQHAKCKMDADQYVDEHSFPGLTGEEIGQRWTERLHLCMNAAGWKVLTDYSTVIEMLEDGYRRQREWLVAHGRSRDDLAIFDRFVAWALDKERKREEARGE